MLIKESQLRSIIQRNVVKVLKESYGDDFDFGDEDVEVDDNWYNDEDEFGDSEIEGPSDADIAGIDDEIASAGKPQNSSDTKKEKMYNLLKKMGLNDRDIERALTRGKEDVTDRSVYGDADWETDEFGHMYESKKARRK